MSVRRGFEEATERHAGQQELRVAMLAAENDIADTLMRFESCVGIQIRRIELVRYDTGYKPLILLGGDA